MGVVRSFYLFIYILAAAPLASKGSVFQELGNGKNGLKPSQDINPEKNSLKPSWDIFEDSLKRRTKLFQRFSEILRYREKKLIIIL